MGTDFARVARLLASPARSAVVDALMADRALAAGELALVAGVRASTMSEHLTELVDGRLLSVISAGRHRYYRLASAEVANALEALSLIGPAAPVRSLRQSMADEAIRLARLCYDHVAGAVGVALLDQLLSSRWLTTGSGADLEVTDAGAKSLAELGVDVAACRRARRHFARSCLDWTERRPHLAGALGAATTMALLDRNWLRKCSDRRGIVVTEAGADGLLETLKISIANLAAVESARSGRD